jgi:repressor LexA
MRSRGYSPSMREIGDAVGLASTSSVSHQLSVLQAKEYLSREPGRPRTMILRLPGQDDATSCPTAAAGGTGDTRHAAQMTHPVAPCVGSMTLPTR